MHVLYLDVLFGLNFYINFIILKVVSVVLNKTLPKRKWLLGSLQLTILYCISILSPKLQKLPTLIVVLVIPVVPLLYLYKPITLKHFFELYIIHFCAAFLIGGTSFGIWNMCENAQTSGRIGSLYVMGAASIVYILCYLAFYKIRTCLITPYFEYELEITRWGQAVHLKAFLDTGNTLYTPMTHQAVIIVTYEGIKDLLTEKEKHMVAISDTGLDNILKEELEDEWQFIPFNSMGCKEGLLLGITCSNIRIKKGKSSHCFLKCTLGISKDNLFKGQAYQALLHPEFIINKGAHDGKIKGVYEKDNKAGRMFYL